jgi:hypothetical protein
VEFSELHEFDIERELLALKSGNPSPDGPLSEH